MQNTEFSAWPATMGHNGLRILGCCVWRLLVSPLGAFSPSAAATYRPNPSLRFLIFGHLSRR